MALLRENTFEGGTDGVAVSNANSGGASGDAFTNVSNTELVYSNVQAKSGTLSARLVNPSGTPAYMGWSGLTLTGAVYFRVFMYLSGLPGTNRLYMMRLLDSGAETVAVMRILSDGSISPADWTTAGFAAEDGPIPTAQWVRMEMRIIAHATAGEYHYRVFSDPDAAVDATPDFSGGATGLALADGIGADNVGDIRFGITQGPAPASPFTVYYDGLAVDTVDWIGPDVTVPTQAILPDADTTTTGWTTTPLFSKINDASDSTVITATLA